MILITGGGGLVGLNLAHALVECGERVLLLQRHETETPPFLAPYWGSEVQAVVGEVLDQSFMSDVIKGYSVESIVHAAATWPGRDTTGASLCDMISINVVATLHMLELARRFGLRRMTFISSSTVYMGIDERLTCTEEMSLPVGPAHAIPATKKACEQICSLYAAQGLSVPSVRVSRVYGPTAHWGRNPMERMVMNTIRGNVAEIADACEDEHISVIHAKDCGTGIALIHLARNLQHRIYNLSDGNYPTYGDAARLLKEIIPGADIRLGATNTRTGGHPAVSIERIRSEGWSPEYGDLRVGLEAYISYVKEGRY